MKGTAAAFWLSVLTVCVRSEIWLSVIARLVSSISTRISLLIASSETVTLLEPAFTLLNSRSTPFFWMKVATPAVPWFEAVFVSPVMVIPSISVCNSVIAAWTSVLAVFPTGVKGTSPAFWLSVLTNVLPASSSIAAWVVAPVRPDAILSYGTWAAFWLSVLTTVLPASPSIASCTVAPVSPEAALS